MKQASTSGEYPVILFAVSVASAYVVTPGRDYPADDPSQPQSWGFSKFYSADPSRSVALMPRYNAHFVPVKYCGRTHCVTDRPLPLDTDYQAAVEGLDASENLLHRAFVLQARLCLTILFCVQRRTSWLHYLPSKRCPLQLFGFGLRQALWRLLQCLLRSFRMQRTQMFFTDNLLLVSFRLANLLVYKLLTGILLPESLLIVK